MNLAHFAAGALAGVPARDLLRLTPPPPTDVEETRDVPPDRAWRWTGTLVARALPLDLDEREYQLILLDGDEWRLAHPDEYSRLGKPVWHLSQRVRRAADRLLDRLALDGAEFALYRPPQPAVLRAHNVACNAGRTSLLEDVIDVAGYTGVQYFEVGQGFNFTPASTDTVLKTPFFRKAISSYSVTGNQALANTVFNANEGNGTYTEAGTYGSAPSLAASATLGTGALWNHALYSYTKSASVQLSNNVYITLS